MAWILKLVLLTQVRSKTQSLATVVAEEVDVNFGDSQRPTVEDTLQEKHHVEPCKTKCSDQCYTEERVRPRLDRSVNSECRGDNDGAQPNYM